MPTAVTCRVTLLYSRDIKSNNVCVVVVLSVTRARQYHVCGKGTVRSLTLLVTLWLQQMCCSNWYVQTRCQPFCTTKNDALCEYHARVSVRPYVCDPVPATKPFVRFHNILFDGSLRKYSSKREFRENPLSDSHTLRRKQTKFDLYFVHFFTDFSATCYGHLKLNNTNKCT
jgi:hypothetical protein